MKTALNRGIWAFLLIFVLVGSSIVMAHPGEKHTAGDSHPVKTEDVKYVNNFGDSCPITSTEKITDRDYGIIEYNGEKALVCCASCQGEFESATPQRKQEIFASLTAHTQGEPLTGAATQQQVSEYQAEIAAVAAAVQGNFLVIGIVNDESASEIEDALVQILSADRTRIVQQKETNYRGQFRFENVPPGQYVLRIAKTGFQTREIELAVNRNLDKYPIYSLASEQAEPAASQETECTSPVLRDDNIKGVCKSPQQCAEDGGAWYASNQCTDDQTCCFAKSSLSSLTEYKQCYDAGTKKITCVASSCPEGNEDVTLSSLYFQDDCEDYCRDFGSILKPGATCTNAKIELCKKGNSYACRNPAAGESCEDYDESIEAVFDTLEACRNELQSHLSQQNIACSVQGTGTGVCKTYEQCGSSVYASRICTNGLMCCITAGQQPAGQQAPSGAITCQQACAARKAISSQCSSYNPNNNFNPYFSGANYNYNPYGGAGYNYNYQGGSFNSQIYGQFTPASGTCSAGQSCWCYELGYQLTFGSVQTIQDYMPLDYEQAKEKTLDELGATVMNPIPMIDTGRINPGHVDDITYDISIKFGGNTISRIQPNNNADSRDRPLFISEGDTSPIQLSGVIGTKSAHCNGIGVTCLLLRDAGCKYDEDWKGIKPRIGYKPQECRSDEYSITKKQHMKTNWGKMLSIPCMVGGGISVGIGLYTGNAQAVDYGVKAIQFCAGTFIGSDLCANTAAATQISINKQGISVGVNREGFAVGGTIPISEEEKPKQPGGITPEEGKNAAISAGVAGHAAIREAGRAAARQTLKNALGFGQTLQIVGGGFGVGCALAPKFRENEEIMCWNVCGKKARSQFSDAPTCPYGSVAIYDDSEGFVSPLYGTYTGPSCSITDVPPEDNPLQQVMVVVTTPEGDRTLAVPAPRGIIGGSTDGYTITPEDLGFSGGYHAGQYEIAISIPENALEPIAAEGGGGGSGGGSSGGAGGSGGGTGGGSSGTGQGRREPKGGLEV